MGRLTWKLPLWVMKSSSKFLLGLGIRGMRMTQTLRGTEVSEGQALPHARPPHPLAGRSPLHAHQQDDEDQQQQAGGDGDENRVDPEPLQLLLGETCEEPWWWGTSRRTATAGQRKEPAPWARPYPCWWCFCPTPRGRSTRSRAGCCRSSR